jgi:hypothetical protein
VCQCHGPVEGRLYANRNLHGLILTCQKPANFLPALRQSNGVSHELEFLEVRFFRSAIEEPEQQHGYPPGHAKVARDRVRTRLVGECPAEDGVPKARLTGHWENPAGSA